MLGALAICCHLSHMCAICAQAYYIYMRAHMFSVDAANMGNFLASNELIVSHFELYIVLTALGNTEGV